MGKGLGGGFTKRNEKEAAVSEKIRASGQGYAGKYEKKEASPVTELGNRKVLDFSRETTQHKNCHGTGEKKAAPKSHWTESDTSTKKRRIWGQITRGRGEKTIWRQGLDDVRLWGKNGPKKEVKPHKGKAKNRLLGKKR